LRQIRQLGADPHLRVEPPFLRHVSDGAAHVEIDRPIADPHLAGVRGEHAQGDPHRRGLAGAVAADEPEDLAGAHAEADVVQRADGAVGLAESVDGESGGGTAGRGDARRCTARGRGCGHGASVESSGSGSGRVQARIIVGEVAPMRMPVTTSRPPMYASCGDSTPPLDKNTSTTAGTNTVTCVMVRPMDRALLRSWSSY